MSTDALECDICNHTFNEQECRPCVKSLSGTLEPGSVKSVKCPTEADGIIRGAVIGDGGRDSGKTDDQGDCKDGDSAKDGRCCDTAPCPQNAAPAAPAAATAIAAAEHRQQPPVQVAHWRDIDLRLLRPSASSGGVAVAGSAHPLLMQLPQIVLDLETFRTGPSLALLDVSPCTQEAIRWFGYLELSLGCMGLGIARHPNGCIVYRCDDGATKIHRVDTSAALDGARGQVVATVVAAPRVIDVTSGAGSGRGILGLYVCVLIMS